MVGRVLSVMHHSFRMRVSCLQTKRPTTGHRILIKHSTNASIKTGYFVMVGCQIPHQEEDV
jgi:hypothetical protein